jgi:hypothetical protein
MGVRLKLTPAIRSRLGFFRVFQAASRNQIENVHNLSKLEEPAYRSKSRKVCLDSFLYQCIQYVTEE